MERPSNLREALLAEALGDLHKLLNRADMLVPVIDEARKAVDDARKALDESRKAMAATVRDMTAAGEGVKRQLLADAEHTKKGALRYVVDNTRLLMAEIAARQTKAMGDTAQSLVEKEVGPKLRELAARLAQQADRANDPWRDWLAHVCTAVLSALFAVMLFQIAAHMAAPSGRPEAVEASAQTPQGPAPEAKASPAPPAAGRRERDKRPGGGESR